VTLASDLGLLDISLQGAPNFRDLGGYPTRDGRRVRRGRLFRSQSFARLTDQDLDAFHRVGIQLVCDLRSDGERARQPNRLPEAFAGESLLVGIDADLRANGNPFWKMIEEDPTPEAARRAMTAIYADLPEAFAEVWPKLLDGLLERERLPAVIHCAAGKDRTGFACAFLLLALDVPREEIYRDYLRTIDHFAPEPAALDLLESVAARRGVKLPLAAVLPLATVEKAFLDTAMGAVEKRYGSADNYLREVAGLDAPRRERLRELLLEGV
jgi:protein-tyrosine phosphatase